MKQRIGKLKLNKRTITNLEQATTNMYAEGPTNGKKCSRSCFYGCTYNCTITCGKSVCTQ